MTETWDFDLNDQLDHSGADDDDDLTLSNGQEALQFTSLIEVTDADDDTVNLGTLSGDTDLFSISIENDIPELTADAASGSSVVSGQVWEDALLSSEDLSQGNPDGDTGETKTLTGDGGTGNPASLSSLVSVGADEDMTFSLVTDQNALDAASAGLTSNGEAVTYAVTAATR